MKHGAVLPRISSAARSRNVDTYQQCVNPAEVRTRRSSVSALLERARRCSNAAAQLERAPRFSRAGAWHDGRAPVLVRRSSTMRWPLLQVTLLAEVRGGQRRDRAAQPCDRPASAVEWPIRIGSKLGLAARHTMVSLAGGRQFLVRHGEHLAARAWISPMWSGSCRTARRSAPPRWSASPAVSCQRTVLELGGGYASAWHVGDLLQLQRTLPGHRTTRAPGR